MRVAKQRSMEVTPTTKELTAINMDGVFNSLLPLWGKRGQNPDNITLNLQNITFVDPYAAAALCVLVRTAKEKLKIPIQIAPQKDNTVVGYLGSLGLWKQLVKYADFDNSLPSTGDSVLHNSNVLLELTPIRKKKDISNAITHLLQIISDNLEYSPKSLSKVINVVDELCTNVLDHSESYGWAAAQRYKHHTTGQRFVRIGVADGGIGIKESLKLRYKKKADKWTHLEAIIKALEKDVSRFTDRGLGLHMIKKIVKDFKGNLHIRSGDSRLFLGKTLNHFQGAWFPGVQVSIDLTENRGA